VACACMCCPVATVQALLRMRQYSQIHGLSFSWNTGHYTEIFIIILLFHDLETGHNYFLPHPFQITVHHNLSSHLKVNSKSNCSFIKLYTDGEISSSHDGKYKDKGLLEYSAV
jgi:hypothetical protein